MFYQSVDKSAATDVFKTANRGRFDRQADPARIGHWLRNGQNPESISHNHRTETLCLVWDDSVAPQTPPTVNVVSDFVDPDIVHVFCNGAPMAEIKGAPELRASDVALIPLSLANAAGLTPA